MRMDSPPMKSRLVLLLKGRSSTLMKGCVVCTTMEATGCRLLQVGVNVGCVSVPETFA